MHAAMIGKSRWAPQLLLGALVCLVLLLFSGKPVHIDDPLYLWAARQIALDPGDFYGFAVNWNGQPEPMFRFFKNPPLTSFYLAGVASLLGWSERALHFGMLVPALAFVLGSAALGRALRADPLAVAALVFATPVVLVSSTTLLPGILLMALWCWAMALWIRGIDEGSPRLLLAAAVLAALCPLVKYVGIGVTPLLALYALARRRGIGAWAGFLVIPLAGLATYSLVMRALYGIDPLLDSSAYSASFAAAVGWSAAERVLVGLVFLGGCLLTGLLLAPWLWSLPALAAGAAVFAATLLALPPLGALGSTALVAEGEARWGLVLQAALLLLCGLQIGALAVSDLWQRRDAVSLLLAAWLGGVFAFAAVLNWTTTARALLPAAPAAALLVVRRLELRRGERRLGSWPPLLAAAALGLALSLAVAWGDQRLAQSARSAAAELPRRYARPHGSVYFVGSWGFQYYMEGEAATRLDTAGTSLRPGDVLIVQQNTSNPVELPQWPFESVALEEFPVAPWVALMSPPRGAGFYASIWGALPFSFGPTPSERYAVFSVVRDVTLGPVSR